jgi:SAM-dependent methyltransferase
MILNSISSVLALPMKVCTFCGSTYSQLACEVCAREPETIDGYVAFAPQLASDHSGYDPGFYGELVQLEAKNFWFRSRNRLILWAFKRYFPQAQSFFEVGCGTGFVLSAIEQAFPSLAVQGSEIFTQGLSFAHQRLERAQLFQMDARNIPFDREFDVIGSFDVLEHIEEDTVVLAEMYRALRPGGGILLTVPQHPWLWSQADSFAHHVRRYRATQLRQKVEKVGFKVVYTTSFVSLLLPLMFASRLQQKKATAHYDPLSELRISGGLNRILEKILAIELKIIQAGISLPWGGSLLLVAKKLDR